MQMLTTNDILNTRNQKHLLEGNAMPAGCKVTCNVIPVNFCRLCSNHTTTYLAQTVLPTDCLRFGKFPPQICESCGTPVDGITKHLVCCKVHLVL